MHSISPRSRQKRGFALAISLALMALIILLSLSLTTMVSVQISSTNASTAENYARESARLGLLVALGELQRATGPDQRVTAKAEIFDDESSVDIQSPHWLGAWDSTLEDWSTLNAQERIARAHWLVSGNSHIIAGTPDNFYPMEDLSAFPEEDKVTIVRDTSTGAEGEVVVLKENIPDQHGRFAYWVADENMKARVDLIDENIESTDHYELTESFQGTQRTGVEYLESLGNYPVNKTQTRLLDGLSNTVAKSQSDATSTIDELQDHYFHSLTAWSSGLLVDVKHGGLKRDLTQAFEYRHIFDEFFVPFDESEERNVNDDGNEVSPVDYQENLYFIEDPVLTANGLDNPSLTTSGPNWSILRSYYRQYLPAGKSPKFHWNRENQTGESASIRHYLDYEEYQELMAEAPDYLAPFIEYEKELTDKTRTRYNKYTGWEHWHPKHSFEPGTSGLPYQTVPSEQGYEGVETKLISPMSDNYQLQSWVSPVISRLQISIGLNNGDHGLELIVTPVLGLYNPYNTAITVTEKKLSMSWNVNPIITIDVDGHALPEPVSFGLREVMPTVNQGRLSYQIGTTTLQPGETRYYGVDINNASYDARRADKGVYLIWPTEFNEQGDVIDVSQNGDSIYMTNYEPGLGGLVIPVELSNINFDPNFQQIGVTEIIRGQDGNYGQNRPTKKRTWGLTGEEVDDLKLLGSTPSSGTSPGFTFGMRIDEDFGAGYNVSWAGGIRLQSITKIFASAPSGSSPIEVSKYFSSLASASNQDQLLSIGFWLKTTDESNTPWRNLVDSNLRAMASNSEWDGFDDDNGYKVLSTYTTKNPDSRGVLESWDSEIQINDPIRSTGYWGNTIEAGGSTQVILFDRPRTPLLSLGNLQHANLGRYNFDPTYMAANSYANVRIPLDQTETESFSSWIYYGEAGSTPDYENFKIFDTSYLINEKLWDRYYFSGLTEDIEEEGWETFKSGTPASGNQRYRYADDVQELAFSDLVDRETDSKLFQQIAAYLQVDGAFNVNSTSVDAWKAVLGGMAQEDFPIYDGQKKVVPGGILVSRFTWPYNGAVNLDTGNNESNFWNGVRELSEDELDDLAQSIVNQVKLRGPFLSMSDFVNRALKNDDTGKSGALQAALDDPALGVNTAAKLGSLSGNAADAIPGYGFQDVFPQTNLQAAGFPGYVMQGDLLQRLGPSLTVRGDTFLIRSYGEYNDPISGNTVGQAWCEAVVQRTAQPVDPDTANFDNEVLLPSSPLGREFKIVSFRWLSDNEI